MDKVIGFGKAIESNENFVALKKIVDNYLNQPSGVNRYNEGTSSFYRVILSEHLGRNIFDNLSPSDYNIWKSKVNIAIKQLDDENISDEDNIKYAKDQLIIKDSKEYGITGKNEQERLGLSEEDIKNL